MYLKIIHVVGDKAKNVFNSTAVLADICEGFWEARNHIDLMERQKIIAAECEILIRSFAKVGIIALVDEATGYVKDKNRAKNELQKFLSQFMREDAAKLVKRFEDSFFEMIYKMRGWTWKHRHHQFLTEEVGIPKLLNHLAAVEALGRASNLDWYRFMTMLDTAFPKQYQQLSFLFDEYDAPAREITPFDKSLKQALDSC